MNAPTMILAVVAIAGGIVLLLLGRGDATCSATGGTLVMAGIGWVGRGAHVANQRAIASEHKAQEALERTQTLRREMMDPTYRERPRPETKP